ncbi:MAG: P1 family peptidase, partial [Rhodanobacter sp.]
MTRCGVIVAMLGMFACMSASAQHLNLRDYGIAIGVMQPGTWNAITDVPGVAVGQKTLIEGDDIRTGVTAILPHAGNIFQHKVPAAVYVGNGFGKLTGTTQIEELGNIETPIVLTNTLSVPTAADALIDYTLGFPENREVLSVNPVVGETNDGYLNDIRRRHVSKRDVLEAITSATGGKVAQGNVGAGTGTVAFGYKGGIGTSSRKLPASLGGYTVGVLVQTNFGGVLTIAGVPIGKTLHKYYLSDKL